MELVMAKANGKSWYSAKKRGDSADIAIYSDIHFQSWRRSNAASFGSLYVAAPMLTRRGLQT
jgi:hypothetical protein